MKKLILILLSVFPHSIFSQTNSDVQRSFVLHFIEENILTIKSKDLKNIQYNPELVALEVSTIGNYNSDFVFYKFILGENNVKANDENLEILFNSSSCNIYILAFNLVDKKSYRVSGFNGNDLLFLIKNINESITEKKSTKKILNELNELHMGVNFINIYNAFRKFEYNADCFKACSEPKEAHGRVK